MYANILLVDKVINCPFFRYFATLFVFICGNAVKFDDGNKEKKHHTEQHYYVDQ